MADKSVAMIIDDPRPIVGLYQERDADGSWRVGHLGTTKIVPYNECGQGSYVIWFAIYKGENIAMRVPGHWVAVEYAHD